MNDLEQWGKRSSGFAVNRTERTHNQAMQNIVNEAREVGMRLDAEAAVAARFMERAVDLDNHRKALAGDDPTLNAVLLRIELGFVAKGERHQRGFNSGFRL
ncbi:hypothetical protein [Curtobacterium sp. B18]|uniref:hypothetical protein n=1 Tax=Curtobacterium sp. B18 TaxID=95614 RepID=UPI00034DF72F|nr:hypothetical protein [Curtobacterium sp. B18]